MNCHRHPNKRVVASCRDCGTGFCIECVRETDQTTLCHECYRRKVSEIARELAPEPEKATKETPLEAAGREGEPTGAPSKPEAAVPRKPAILAPSEPAAHVFPPGEAAAPEEAPPGAGSTPAPVERKVPRLRPLRRGFILPGRRKRPETVLPEEEEKKAREVLPEVPGEEVDEIIQELEQGEALEIIEEEAREAVLEEEREETLEIARGEEEETAREEGREEAPAPAREEATGLMTEGARVEALEIIEEEAREAVLEEEREETLEIARGEEEETAREEGREEAPAPAREEATGLMTEGARVEALEIIEEEAREAVLEEEREETLEIARGEEEETAREEGREEAPAPAREEAAAEEETREEKGEEAREEETSAFLAQGPDEDFSQLVTEGPRFRLGKKRDRAAVPDEVPPAEGETAEAPVEEAPVRLRPPRAARHRGARKPARQDSSSEDLLLEDVVATLLKPGEDAGSGEIKPSLTGMVEPRGSVAATAAEAGGAVALPRPGEEAARPRGRRAARREERRKERRERWDFIAQGRSAEHTLIAGSWWRAALFVAIMLLLGAVLWAVPNAYLVPKDTEYGIHAVGIGVLLGLLFWWKAGRKHGTKLAVQAALVTFFSLAVGEFIHWFLIIMKNAAFRTILFDLVSFRFLWENGAEIMRYTVEAMFPGAFVWVLILPSVMAFVIGFGMPPIPEVFFQFGRALRE
ncbi:MAG: hypothetical protein H5T73_09400 [Actinobacteria bacterium]|nr:hypothetical protein [Actinomycetota bacterium]